VAVGVTCAGASGMDDDDDDFWRAVVLRDVAEVERQLRQDPRLINAKGGGDITPLMWASGMGHERVVRWLLDNGAAINEREWQGATALWGASHHGQTTR
jgi:ankyrin repeat protein